MSEDLLFPKATTRNIAIHAAPGYRMAGETVQYLRRLASEYVQNLAAAALRFAEADGAKTISAHHIRLADEARTGGDSN